MRPDGIASVRFVPVPSQGDSDPAFRLHGVWQAEGGDPRLGGVSALALRNGRLLALTDSGTLIDLPRPPGGPARFRDLPAGPGSPLWKKYRDSESLIADPHGRGWWVGFEFRHSLYLFDRDFRRPLRRIRFPATRWRPNTGIEALAVHRGKLLVIPETGREVLEYDGTAWSSLSLTGATGAPADAVTLPDGRIIVALRELGIGGITNRLALLIRTNEGYRLTPVGEVPVGPFDNVEGIAAERMGGGIRLWLMTDSDFSKRRATLLIALDLPAEKRRR